MGPMFDDFLQRHLPSPQLCPRFDWVGTEEVVYPARLNAAAELLDAAVREGFGDKVALIFGDETWTYSALLAQANRIAATLTQDFRLIRGNRVLLRGFNHPALVAAWFAVLKVGAVAVTTMPALKARELAEIIDKARVNLVLCEARLADGDLETALARASFKPADVCIYGGASGEERGLEARSAHKAISFENAETSATDPAILAFTSGTTGRAKGTVHFHRDLLAVTDTFGRHVLKLTAADVCCGSPSLAFTYGLGGLLLFAFRVRAASAFVETPEGLLAAIQKHRATALFGSPPLYRVFSDLVDRYDIGSLRTCVSAGETLPASVYEKWRSKTGIRIVDGIGSTEMLHIFISCAAEATRPGFTGKVVPGYEAAILDDGGKPLPPGTIGRLAVRGPTGCRYLDDESNQRRYVQDGWNFTGDAYLVGSDGYFQFHSRIDDLIITSGLNVSGAEVEAVILEHPRVRECAVVGHRDARSGDMQVRAYVVPAGQAEASGDLARELVKHVRSQLADFKCPRHVELVAELPRTATGKVQRFRLRNAGSESSSGKNGLLDAAES